MMNTSFLFYKNLKLIRKVLFSERGLFLFMLSLIFLLPDNSLRAEIHHQYTLQTVNSKDDPTTNLDRMMLIPAGEYTMGFEPQKALIECKRNNSPCKLNWFKDEEPIHKVYLDAFHIDVYEITQEEYKKATGENPSEFQGGRLPVERVTWQESNDYCKNIGKRLPTEAEWEVAARGGMKDSTYSWGNIVESGKANFCDLLCEKKWKEKHFEDGFTNTAPVGSFPPNSYGLYDMAGNVYEWVFDWYDKEYYSNSPKKNPKGPQIGEYRVMRGGSWINYSVGVRPADRTDAKPSKRLNFVGFRCAK